MKAIVGALTAAIFLVIALTLVARYIEKLPKTQIELARLRKVGNSDAHIPKELSETRKSAIFRTVGKAELLDHKTPVPLWKILVERESDGLIYSTLSFRERKMGEKVELSVLSFRERRGMVGEKVELLDIEYVLDSSLQRRKIIFFVK